MAYQELFDLLSQEHDITALESEMQEIIHVVHKNHGYDELKKAVKKMRAIQKRYFQLKIKKASNELKQSVLIESKELEKVVDELISDKLF